MNPVSTEGWEAFAFRTNAICPQEVDKRLAPTGAVGASAVERVESAGGAGGQLFWAASRSRISVSRVMSGGVPGSGLGKNRSLALV